jgi:hypothetical protein
MTTEPLETEEGSESGGSGEEFGGKCHHTCPVPDCTGRCQQTTGHAGYHECPNGHSPW